MIIMIIIILLLAIIYFYIPFNFQIKRIEDKYKYLQYMSKKKQIDNQNQNTKGIKNERILWHGTDSDTYGKIIKHGFDRSFAGKNGNYTITIHVSYVNQEFEPDTHSF